MPRPAHRDYTGSMPLRPRYTRAYGRHRPVCGGRCLLAHLEPGENAAPCSAGLVLFPTVGWFLFVAPRLTALGMLTTIALSLLVGAGRRARAPSRARRRHTNPAFSRLNRALARDPDGAGGLLVASLAFLLLAMFTEVRAGSRGARARDRI
jgi:hypothetical protein